MKVLIDTNVLLDVLQNRKPFVDNSLIIWNLCETGMLTGCVSTLSIANLSYIMRKELSPEMTANVLTQLNSVFQFVDLSPDIVLKAAKLQWRDFEDAVQAVTAKQNRCEVIITRNVKDFENSQVYALNPKEWIEKYLITDEL